LTKYHLDAERPRGAGEKAPEIAKTNP